MWLSIALDSGEPSFEELPLITHTSWWGVHTHSDFFFCHITLLLAHLRWIHTQNESILNFLFTYSLGNYQLRSVNVGSDSISQTHPKALQCQKTIQFQYWKISNMMKKSYCVSCQRYTPFGLFLEDQRL